MMRQLLKRALVRGLAATPIVFPLPERLCKLRQRAYHQSLQVAQPYHGQFGQDRYVHLKFFAGSNQPGVFVDIGAYDGELFSNSLYFEQVLGWKGLAIEPNPAVFKQLQAKRHCHCLNVAIAQKDGHLPFISVEGYGETLSRLSEGMAPAHLNRIEETLASCGGKKTLTQVATRPLQGLLDEIGIAHIDFLSVDTEGGELGILDTLDWRRVAVGVIAIEQNDGCNSVEKFMRRRGFSLRAIVGSDAIFACRRRFAYKLRHLS